MLTLAWTLIGVMVIANVLISAVREGQAQAEEGL